MVPISTQVLVIGGGPGGSYTAAVLAREGLDVVVLEAQKFPRYHIGESMLPSFRHFMRFIDLEDVFENAGFAHKVGAAFRLTQEKKDGYTQFIANDGSNYSWNVIRSQADEMLLRHAAHCGATVIEETRVTDIVFSDEPGRGKPTSVLWQKRDGTTGRLSFEWLVDASGRNGMMCQNYLHNRKYDQSFKNVAFWGYFRNTGTYAPGTNRAGAPFFEALDDGSGWAWFIPLHNGTTSVGVVMDQVISKTKRAAASDSDSSLKTHYITELKRAPGIMGLIGTGALDCTNGEPKIRTASDYSYSASSYSGDNYRIVGDAGAFIDPYFSSGVHLALASALSAAASICAVIRGDCTKEEASHFHTEKIATAYVRFLLIVMTAYRQIRSQSAPVLSDIGENDFDRAFAHFRTVIQGRAEVMKNLSDQELRQTVDFCKHAFEPTLPDERSKMSSHLKENFGGDTFSNGNVLSLMQGAPGYLSADSQKVLNSMLARKLLRMEDEGIDTLVSDEIDGLKLRMEKGNLGMGRV